MKNKTTVDNQSPLGGLEPDIDGTYDSRIVDLTQPYTAGEKVRQEHQLRDLEEKAYWRGYNDGIDACQALLDATYDFHPAKPLEDS